MRSYYLPDLDAYIRCHELPGAGPVRLYLHGFPWASSACFPAVAAHPALHGRRSLLVDLLGFGFSDAPPGFDYTAEELAGVLARLLDALKVKDCQVVGQSWGGTVAVERNLPITASLVGAVQKADPLAVYRSARALYQTDCREAFLRLALPKVYVTSEKAATYPVDPAPLAAQGVPCLQVPIAGRAPMLENPDGYAETLARALQ